jgi:hypothetical protein
MINAIEAKKALDLQYVRFVCFETALDNTGKVVGVNVVVENCHGVYTFPLAETGANWDDGYDDEEEDAGVVTAEAYHGGLES